MKQNGRLYGLFCWKGKTVRAHRAAWELYVGPIPSGTCVLHKCDIPQCVNPDHLFLGSQLDNIKDRNVKGRAKAAKGEKHHLAKLTDEIVLKIRAAKNSGLSLSYIGRQYGVNKTTIGRVLSRKTWRHV